MGEDCGGELAEGPDQKFSLTLPWDTVTLPWLLTKHPQLEFRPEVGLEMQMRWSSACKGYLSCQRDESPKVPTPEVEATWLRTNQYLKTI